MSYARHGLSSTPTYYSWQCMKRRCEDKGFESYAHYGGKGIRFVERWRHFENFLADMGKRPSRVYTLDRIDRDKGYSPTNCRWATYEQQNRNLRTTKLDIKKVQRIRFLLKKKIPQSQIAKQFGIDQPTICRINTGKRWVGKSQ